MRAGELRHRIIVQKRATTQDSFGGQSTDWAEILKAWAHIAPLTGRELMAAQAVQSETTHAITLRFNALFARPADVTKYRILWNGRNFDISGSINEDERNRQVVLAAKEGLSDG